ncbi:hypothetical protein BGZ80_006644 [Entomortierella chlamydospora]|uniref:DUF159-domain-containing protein n=1 Tax=Entomortierella chlamydospora TaxID=101097 RepID=A0A9P6T2D5_9FUNG|nr:hypothetical protein BGZ79_007956 [Entomortierella chlamydospora]KAG0018850.1 hypothetical protein BGZ80_006644 [Entomortierella chlamydospora]
MPNYNSVLKSINARDDSLFTGPTGKAMFSHSKNHKRCILLAEGFYEWRRRGKERVPFYTKRRDGNLMLMAAIYDVAQIQGSEESLYTYATITTNASPQLDWLHDRMPVLIPNGDHQKIRMWLDPNLTWNSALEAMLKPCDEFIEADESSDLGTCTAAKKVYALETYQVDEKVNSVKNDSPEFAKPWNSSSNKKTLNRFFSTKAECHDIPASRAIKQERGIDELTKGQPKSIILEWEQGRKQEPLRPDMDTMDIDSNNVDYWEGQNEESGNECKSKDEDEDDHCLKRALELSLQEQNFKDTDSTLYVSNATKAPTFRNIQKRDEKTNVDPSASIDLLEKRRNELQQEEEEMKKVLELSLLQAIADGHEDIDLQGDAQLPEGGKSDVLTKKEQEELEKAIAESLNDPEFQHETSLSQQSTTSSTTAATATMSSPGSKKMATSVNLTPKKRKSSTGVSASHGGGGSSKNRKSNQDTKITSFFQHANPH